MRAQGVTTPRPSSLILTVIVELGGRETGGRVDVKVAKMLLGMCVIVSSVRGSIPAKPFGFFSVVLFLLGSPTSGASAIS